MTTNENFIHNKYGYCYYSVDQKSAIVFNLYVRPKYRRKGHARELIQFVINEIRKTGYAGEIQIEARPKRTKIDLKRLIQFYQGMGLKVLNSCEVKK